MCFPIIFRPIGAGSQRVHVTGDGTLEIKSVRPADVGDYMCMLTSAGGNETRSAKLSVIGIAFYIFICYSLFFNMPIYLSVLFQAD